MRFRYIFYTLIILLIISTSCYTVYKSGKNTIDYSISVKVKLGHKKVVMDSKDELTHRKIRGTYQSNGDTLSVFGFGRNNDRRLKMLEKHTWLRSGDTLFTYKDTSGNFNRKVYLLKQK